MPRHMLWFFFFFFFFFFGMNVPTENNVVIENTKGCLLLLVSGVKPP